MGIAEDADTKAPRGFRLLGDPLILIPIKTNLVFTFLSKMAA